MLWHIVFSRVVSIRPIGPAHYPRDEPTELAHYPRDEPKQLRTARPNRAARGALAGPHVTCPANPGPEPALPGHRTAHRPIIGKARKTAGYCILRLL